MALYMDAKLTKNSKDNLALKSKVEAFAEMEAHISLFLLLNERDYFSATYSMYLSHRLLEEQSVGLELEEYYVKLLKNEGEKIDHMAGMISEWFSDSINPASGPPGTH